MHRFLASIHQLLQQVHKQFPIETALVSGKPECAFGADCGRRTDTLPLSGSVNHRRFPALYPSLAMHRVRMKAGLVPKSSRPIQPWPAGQSPDRFHVANAQSLQRHPGRRVAAVFARSCSVAPASCPPRSDSAKCQIFPQSNCAQCCAFTSQNRNRTVGVFAVHPAKHPLLLLGIELARSPVALARLQCAQPARLPWARQSHL
jgi:hypothetical protein